MWTEPRTERSHNESEKKRQICARFRVTFAQESPRLGHCYSDNSPWLMWCIISKQWFRGHDHECFRIPPPARGAILLNVSPTPALGDRWWKRYLQTCSTVFEAYFMERHFSCDFMAFKIKSSSVMTVMQVPVIRTRATPYPIHGCLLCFTIAKRLPSLLSLLWYRVLTHSIYWNSCCARNFPIHRVKIPKV